MRFHLSTCLFTVFIAAGLLWVNFTNERYFDPRNASQGFPVCRYVRWPFPAIALPPPNHPDFEDVLLTPLMINVLVSIAIMLLSSVIFECFIRLSGSNRNFDQNAEE